MDFEILSWFGNLINFFVFLYLAIGVIGTNCFDVSQIFISIFGLFTSIFIQVIVVYYRRIL
jgi:hypothetical protein